MSRNTSRRGGSWGRVATILVALFAIVPGAGLAGCAGQRPITDIRASADALMGRGEYASAAAEYRLIADREAGDWRAQHRLGLCCLELNQLADARRALEIAHTRRPGDEAIVDALAETMFRQGDQNRLFSFLRQRAESTGTVEGWLRLARYASAMGDADSAQRAFETAIVLDGGRGVQPYLDAAVFAEQVGNRELAVRRLRQAYGIDPYDQRVSERLVAAGEIPGPTLALPPGR